MKKGIILVCMVMVLLAAAVGLGVWIYNIKAGDAAGERAAASMKSMDKANEALGLQLQPLIDRYEVLRGTQARSAEQEAELISLGNQIAQLAPRVASGFDLQGNAIIGSDFQLKQLIRDLLQYTLSH